MRGFFADEREAQDTVETLNVDLGERSYPIFIGPGLLKETDRLRSHLGQGQAVIISNDTVAPLYLDQVKQTLGDSYGWEIILPDGETHKTLGTISQIYDRLLRAKADRQTTLVALGGGVIGDITGFAAAPPQRGIDFIQIPTTLLAQVDSSVGGKTAVNHPAGKNMIGAFYQPKAVVADTTVLTSLPPREYAAGLAEVVKYGVIDDVDFFHWLEESVAALHSRSEEALQQVIFRSCASKAKVVREDERESGRRAILNFGHTFGHAIEKLAGYGEWLHGEAVAIGMVMAAELSVRHCGFPQSDALRLRALLKALGLPVTLGERRLETEAMIEAMGLDKKVNDGQLRFVLARQLGDVYVSDDVNAQVLREVLDMQQW